jgi:hypothetical protein
MFKEEPTGEKIFTGVKYYAGVKVDMKSLFIIIATDLIIRILVACCDPQFTRPEIVALAFT